MAVEYNDNEYIKLFRKMINWEWYTDINTKVLFVHILLKANWKDGRWKGIAYKRGQLIASIGTLAKETGLTYDQVRTALKHLQDTKEITYEKIAKGGIITVVEYNDYQDVPTDIPRKNTHKSQASPTDVPRTSQQYKNIKNSKEDKEDKKYIGAVRYFPNDDELEETFHDFITMRNKIKKPMTDRAIDLMLRKLERMTIDPREQVKILEQSITHCWQDIYPLKEDKKDNSQSGQSMAEKWGIEGDFL